MEEALQDVGTDTPSSASTEGADSSSAVVESSVEQAAHVTGTDGATSTAVETQADDDPLKDVPTLEELQKQEAEKVPYAAALARLRTAYEGVKPQLEAYKSLDPWKEVATAIPDPNLAKSAYELVAGIHTPEPNNQSGFSTVPFLQKLEADSPGAVDQIFADLLPFQYTRDDGVRTTLVRELYRGHGLDPDRIDEYRNIDTLRTSGVVTAEELTKIDVKYHEAFKSLPRDAQEDILALKESNPTVADMHLRNANDSLEARTWREKNEQAQVQAAEQAAQQHEQQVVQAVEEDIIGKSQSMHDSVHQSLSQITFSSDPKIDAIEKSTILGVIGNLQSPYPVYRNNALKTLELAGINPEGFDQLTTDLQTEREKVVRYQHSRDANQQPSWNERQALAAANLAEQRILLKAQDYVRRLAETKSQRVANAAGQQESALAAATARFVPNGNGNAQQGATNPYSQNPHPVGSPEWSAYYKQVDKELGLHGAAMLGGN